MKQTFLTILAMLMTLAANAQHEYVDLELPSGTLWATCNVGANSPEGYGDHFAWGETTTKSDYSWGTYKWMTAGKASWAYINKYTFDDGQPDGCWYSGYNFVGDGRKELDLEDDAARANWGAGWRMPSDYQFQELINEDYTTTIWTTLHGINGRKITSKQNGNSIFLPAAGVIWDDKGVSNAGSFGYYWSRSIVSCSDRATSLVIKSEDAFTSYADRYQGRSIRPVFSIVENIILDPSSLRLSKSGETGQLTATVVPWGAIQELTWESSNASVATVSSNGLVTAKNRGTCTITCRATDGSGVYAECEVVVAIDNSGSINGHDYVDLGLPSGTLWATCNLGVGNPYRIGVCCAWGEVGAIYDYGWETYKYCQGSDNTLTKYCTNSGYGYNGFTDDLTELLPEDDAATVNWGREWQIPSIEQFQELFNSEYTTITCTTKNGLTIQSKNTDKSLILPVNVYQDYEYSNKYWSRSLNTDKPSQAYYWDITYRIRSEGTENAGQLDYKHFASHSGNRSYPLPIRPVINPNPQEPLRGDVNGDGKVDIADVITVLNIMAGVQ